jgi:3-hydroxyisobutyrate dehydrogenase-like beta-hydroxyacid dehydrogenase
MTEAGSVLGLGNMGSALGGALLAAGHDVTVWNRTPSRMEPLKAKGAVGVHTAVAAFEASSVVLASAAAPALSSWPSGLRRAAHTSSRA